VVRKLIVGVVFMAYVAIMANICINYGTRPFPFEMLIPVGQPHLNTVYESADHEKFGLAYKVGLFSDGAWVGYLDQRHFVPMIPGKEQDFFKGFGLPRAPEVPETPLDWTFYRWATYIVSAFSLALRFGLFAVLDLIEWQQPLRKREEDEEEAVAPRTAKILEAAAAHRSSATREPVQQSVQSRQSSGPLPSNAPVFGRRRMD